MQPLARSRARGLAAGGLGVIVVAAVYHAIDSIGGPYAVRERYGAWGFAVSFVAHWVLSLTPLGGFVPTAAANGALWGFWVGALVSWAGWLAASLTQYLLVRRVSGEPEVSEIRARLPDWLGRLPVEHPLVQIGGRSLPWVGLHVVSVSAALAGVPLGRFLAYAALGQAGPALAMAALGSGLFSIFATSCGQDVCRHPDGIVVNEQRRTFGGPSLSLVTLNLLSGGPFPSFLGLPGSEEVYDTSMRDRLALQAKGLARELPDVLVLQEVSGTTPARYCSMLDALTEGLRLADSEAAYNVAFAVGDRDLLTNRWYSGVAILSRFELRAARIYRFPTQGTLGLENRVALKVSIRGDHGDVDVITTHLQYGGDDVTAAQVRELLDWIPQVADSRTTTVLAGDFNLPPESRPIRRIIEQGFVDAWSEVSPDDPGHTFRHEGLYDAAGRARERLDYVFLSEETEIRAARLVLNRPIDLGPGRPKRWLWPSDHNGVRVDLIPVAY